MAQSELTADLFKELGLDWTRLVAPIKGGSAGGEDIRYSADFDALADARREEDDSEQGIWQVDAKKADWRSVVTLATEILATRSKDLQVAVWLVQGLFHLHGLRGLAAGLAVVARIAKTLWPVLWPQPDGDDLEPRLAPFFWIDSHMTGELTKIEITEAEQGQSRGYTYQQLVKARDLERIASNRPKVFEDAMADGEVSLERIQQALSRSSTEFLMDRWSGTQLALSGLKRLAEAVDASAGQEAPSFKAFRQTLADMDRLFTQALADRQIRPAQKEEKRKVQEPEKGTKVSASTSSHAAAGAAAGGLPVIKDRRAAYALLSHVAEWLLAHEPHSPAPFLVRRAVSWESMSLGDVLADLMASGTDIDATLKVLGITSDDRNGSGRRRTASAYGDE